MDAKPMTLTFRQWRFGPDWPGERCGAKTRAGTPCRKPALRGKQRCQLHGGRAGAPSGPRNGRYRHGGYTKEALEARRQRAQQTRETYARLRMLEKLGERAGIL